MFLAPLPAQDAIAMRCVTDTVTSDVEDRATSGALSEITWANTITIGRTRYPLRRELTGTALPVAGTWQVLVEGLSPQFVGQGKNIRSAQEDLMLQIHSSFQNLYSKRAFQMSPEDKALWGVLSAVIDVAAYENETPITVREVGKVLWDKRVKFGYTPRHILVRWEHGGIETLNTVEAPREVAGLRPGMCFEAITARNPKMDTLVDILHAARISSPGDVSDDDIAAMLESAVDSRTLPEADPLA